MIAGIDTHKDTLAVAIVDDGGGQLLNQEVANTAVGFARLVELLEQHHVGRVGIEGSGTSGGPSRCTWSSVGSRTGRSRWWRCRR